MPTVCIKTIHSSDFHHPPRAYSQFKNVVFVDEYISSEITIFAVRHASGQSVLWDFIDGECRGVSLTYDVNDNDTLAAAFGRHRGAASLTNVVNCDIIPFIGYWVRTMHGREILKNLQLGTDPEKDAIIANHVARMELLETTTAKKIEAIKQSTDSKLAMIDRGDIGKLQDQLGITNARLAAIKREEANIRTRHELVVRESARIADEQGRVASLLKNSRRIAGDSQGVVPIGNAGDIRRLTDFIPARQ